MPAVKPINKGDTFHICAPSSWLQPQRQKRGVSFLEKQGYGVALHPQVEKRDFQCAGTAEERAEALAECFASAESQAVLTAVGGHRALHTLDMLDYDLIQKHPKPFIGFSDTTAQLNAIYAKTGMVTFHGPSLASLGDGLHPSSIDTFFKVLGGEKITYPAFDTAEVLTPGRHGTTTKGTLVGGNLCLFTNLIGTHYMPRLDDAILFLEDDSEEIRNLDRMFLHLKTSGILQHINALILGQFSNTQDSEKVRGPFCNSLDDLMHEHFSHLDIPVIKNAPFGHGKDLLTFPIGARAMVDIRQTPTLQLV